MDTDYIKLLRSAFDAYLQKFEDPALEPSANYLTYDFDQIDTYSWEMLGGFLVQDELREVTNILNYWQSSLHRWQTWNAVVGSYGADDAWELRREFLEALAYQCLFQPSAVRDTLTFIATNAIHQIRLTLGNGYRDHLEGDPESPNERPKHFSRRRKEQRLADLTAGWPEAKGFLEHLRQIDDAPYRQATSDYRNRSSHAIGPRLAVGHTRAVVRSVVQATRMKELADGKFAPTPIPGKMSVTYEFGGTPPLDMEQARLANLEQYRRARSCYEHYRGLLAAAMTAMPSANSTL